jgi:ABC-2 type transport system permease protein
MSPRRVAAVAHRILQGLRRDRRTLGLLFGVPLVILTLFWYLLRGGSTHPAVGVIQLDQGVGPLNLGQAVAAQLHDSSTVDVHDYRDQAGAEGDLEQGRLAGYVVFPPDFSSRTLTEHVIAPDIRLEGSQPDLNAAVLQSVSAALSASLSQISGPSAPRLQVSVSYLHGSNKLDTLDFFGAAFIGLVVFFLVYIITSIAFLRERSQGTLERLMASPLRRSEVVVGYMLGFGGVALVQAAIVLAFALYVIHLYNAGSVGLLFLFDALLAIGALNLGIFFSTFARNEFQAIQFIPLVLVPQVLLSGIIFPVSTEPGPLQPVSNVLPLTYAVYGMRAVMLGGEGLGSSDVLLDLAVLAFFALVAIALAGLTLRRRIAY